MSSKLDVYKAYYEASKANPPSSNVKAVETYYSDDFQSLDKDGNVVMNKEAYVGMVQLLFTAFKDFEYLTSDLREEGDSVIVSGHFEGTHTGDFELSAMGMGVIPASGKRVFWPEDTIKITVEGDNVRRIDPQGDMGTIEEFLVPLMG